MAKYDLTPAQVNKSDTIIVWRERANDTEEYLFKYKKINRKWVQKIAFSKRGEKPTTPSVIIKTINEFMAKCDALKTNYTLETESHDDTLFWVESSNGKRSKLIHRR